MWSVDQRLEIAILDEREPQQVRSQARRVVILEAAARAFDRVGYGTASLSEIAREAGVGQGLIYFYFRTKQALALAVIEEQNSRTFAAMRKESDAATSPMTALIRASRSIAVLLLVDPIVRAGIRLSLEQGVFADPTSDFYDQWIQGVIDAFRAADSAGELATHIAPERLGASVVAYFTGVQLVSNVRFGRKDLMEVLETMWTVLVSGVVSAEHREGLQRLVVRTFTSS